MEFVGLLLFCLFVFGLDSDVCVAFVAYGLFALADCLRLLNLCCVVVWQIDLGL